MPLLWQHLFWFFGHPEVYIVVLPYFGVITEVIPVFSWRPVFGYRGIVLATLAIAALSVGVWAHHMFATGAVLLPFFSGLSFLIAVPDRREDLQLDRHDVGRRIAFPTPMLFALGFLFTFVLGGVTGVILASPPLDFHLHDSYFVVAHMHYVLFGGSVFALFAGVYYWFPKFTGRMLSEGLGRVHVAMTFVGLPPHVLRAAHARPRGHAPAGGRLPPEDGFTGLNRMSSIGAYLLGASMLPFLWNVWRSAAAGRARRRRPVGRPHPRVGDDLTAAARQLRPTAAADPLEPAGVGPPPRAAGTRAQRAMRVPRGRGPAGGRDRRTPAGVAPGGAQPARERSER